MLVLTSLECRLVVFIQGGEVTVTCTCVHESNKLVIATELHLVCNVKGLYDCVTSFYMGSSLVFSTTATWRWLKILWYWVSNYSCMAIQCTYSFIWQCLELLIILPDCKTIFHTNKILGQVKGCGSITFTSCVIITLHNIMLTVNVVLFY